MTYQNSTSLDDLFITAEPAQPRSDYQRAADGPEPASATRAAPDPVTPASGPLIIGEAIPSIMTEAEIAALLGIATSQVRTKTREGHLVKAGRARWDVRRSVLGYLDHLRGIAARTGPGVGAPSDDYKAERLRLAKQQADKIEIQNNAARGELVRAADVEREWANVLRDIRSTMLAVSSRAGAKLPHLTAHDIAEIDREIKATLEGLANGN